jgi:hydroxypyruvate isomerase
MPRLAANVSMLFTEFSPLDRFQAAAEAGFRAVEMQFPHAPPGDIAERLTRHQLEMVMFNLPAGDWAAGERGIACLPGREDEFRQGVIAGIAAAQALGVTKLNCLAGIAPPSGHRAIRETLIANLRHAAEALADVGMILLVEPINSYDVPGFYLTRTRQTLDLLEDVGMENVMVQYDAYHMQMMEGDLTRTLERHLDRIGHIQIACPPGRGEPGTGEIDIPYLLGVLDRLGYAGWVGCEYRPVAGTLAGLDWAKPWLA